MSTKARFFVSIEDHTPAATVSVQDVGGVVNGAQSAVNTVVVHEHGLEANEKFLYAKSRVNVLTDRVFTVSSTAATSVTFSGDAYSFPDKAMLVNLGTDTISANTDGSWPVPNWDGSTVSAYKDAAGDDSWTNSEVTVDPGNECGWWGESGTVWAVVLDNGNKPVRVYPDVTGSGASGAITVTRGTALPASATLGDAYLLSQSTDGPDIFYRYMTYGSGTDQANGWVEAYSGPD